MPIKNYKNYLELIKLLCGDKAELEEVMSKGIASEKESTKEKELENGSRFSLN